MSEIIERTQTILKETSINKTLLQDVYNTVASIYRMNAPYAIGYLFTVTKNGKEIHTGMYCNFTDEIDADRWSYFLDFKTREFFKLEK